MKVLATRRYPGPAFDDLRDVEVAPLAPRDDAEALIVANEPIDPSEFPALRLVANFGVGYDRLGVDELRRRGIAVANTPGILDAATAARPRPHFGRVRAGRAAQRPAAVDLRRTANSTHSLRRWPASTAASPGCCTG